MERLLNLPPLPEIQAGPVFRYYPSYQYIEPTPVYPPFVVRRGYFKCCVLYVDEKSTSIVIPLINIDNLIIDELIDDFKEIQEHEAKLCDGKCPIFCFEKISLWKDLRKRRNTSNKLIPKLRFYYTDDHFDEDIDFFENITDRLSYDEIINLITSKYNEFEYSLGLGYIPKFFESVLKFLKENPLNRQIEWYDLDICDYFSTKIVK